MRAAGATALGSLDNALTTPTLVARGLWFRHWLLGLDWSVASRLSWSILCHEFGQALESLNNADVVLRTRWDQAQSDGSLRSYTSEVSPWLKSP